MDGTGLAGLDSCITGCRACPRLVAWREEVALTKRAAFADQTYWGGRSQGSGRQTPRFSSLASRPPRTAATGRAGCLRATGPVMCSTRRCTMQDSRRAALPAFGEAGWLVPRPRPTFAHGARVTLRPDVARSSAAGLITAISSGSESIEPVEVFGCFHVSQHNTVTGRLTPEMLRDVLRTAADAAGLR